MRRWTILTIACLGLALWLQAHTFYTTKITWSSDVSRVVYRNCASCHHPGGSAFSLLTYKEARPWAEAIKQQVLERHMPPWNAVKGFGDFKDDRGLPQEDLEIVGEWVNGGAPEGNPIYMPAVPDFIDAPDENHAGEQRIAVHGSRVMKHGVRAIGIDPGVVPSAGALQVVAYRPDGSIEPLIWLEKFNPQYKKTYYFREPLLFPAGTRIETLPRQGSVALVLKNNALKVSTNSVTANIGNAGKNASPRFRSPDHPINRSPDPR
ncbi:MAG TPA: cytochrome c [Candidatus Saccharimonadales bacterium]|nr:cytochrome c [Candidatus Saccharimonadales bacterium]